MSGSGPRGDGGDSGDEVRTPAAPASAEIREKGSRFLAVVAPATSEEAAKEILAALTAEHRNATHHCYAWRIAAGPEQEGPRERSADAGEPAGTAGAPILAVLRGAGLCDVVAVVVRWYGGTKLGKGGLARAYAAATREALAGLRIEERAPTATLELAVPFERLGAVKRLVHPPRVEIGAERYGPGGVRLSLIVRLEALGEIETALADLGLAP